MALPTTLPPQFFVASGESPPRFKLLLSAAVGTTSMSAPIYRLSTYATSLHEQWNGCMLNGQIWDTPEWKRRQAYLQSARSPDGKTLVELYHEGLELYSATFKAFLPVLHTNRPDLLPTGHFAYRMVPGPRKMSPAPAPPPPSSPPRPPPLQIPSPSVSPFVSPRRASPPPAPTAPPAPPPPPPLPRFVAEALVRDAMTQKGACPVSMLPFEECAGLRVTSCYHIFEEEALMTWLKSKPSCPVCKQLVGATTACGGALAPTLPKIEAGGAPPPSAPNTRHHGHEGGAAE